MRVLLAAGEDVLAPCEIDPVHCVGCVKAPLGCCVYPDQRPIDLYKWAYKLSPAVPSDLVMDCFDLAREIRELDMRASPYDLRELGYEPVRVETPEGRARYAAAQRGFSVRSQALRERLLTALAAVAEQRSVSAGQPPP